MKRLLFGKLIILILFLTIEAVFCKNDKISQNVKDLDLIVDKFDKKGKVCANIQMEPRFSELNFQLMDRENFSKGFQVIRETDSLELFESYSILEDGCRVQVCTTCIEPNLDCNSIKCYDFYQKNRNFERKKHMYWLTVSCSCKKSPKTCKSTFCKFQEKYIGDKCGLVYKESNCRTCDYDPIAIEVNGEFFTNNTFTPQSLVVRKGCQIFLSGDDILINFTESANELVLRDRVKLIWCECDTNSHILDLTHNNKAGNSEDDPVPHFASWKIALLVIGIVVSILIIVLSLKFAHNWRPARKTGKWEINPNRPANFNFKTDEFSIENETKLDQILPYGYKRFLRRNSPENAAEEEELPKVKSISIDRVIKKTERSEIFGGWFVRENGEMTNIALKRILENRELIISEIKINKHIGKHLNIVKFYGICTGELGLIIENFIITEYCPNGDLKGYFVRKMSTSIKRNNNCKNDGYKIKLCAEKIPPEQLLRWAKEIACGMKYLAEIGIIHFDLAARNIFLTANLTAKIGDFGLSKLLQTYSNYSTISTSDKNIPIYLPVYWMALESLQNCINFSVKSDVWSFGVVLWEIFTLGKNPYFKYNFNLAGLIQFLERGRRLSKPKNASDIIYRTMVSCWSSDKEKRPDFGYLEQFFTRELSQLGLENEDFNFENYV